MPSTNTAFEGWLPRVAPEGVSFHFGRMPFSRATSIENALEEMESEERAAVRRVMDCEPDALLYACTASSILKGVEGDRALIAKLREQTGVPCTTIAEAIVRAFERLGVSRICIASPYPAKFDRLESDFFNSAGLEVVDVHGLDLNDPADMCDVPPGEIYRFARSVWNPSADALLVTCAAFRGQSVVAALEEDLGVPVVTSLTASLWAGLRIAGVMTPVHGFGAILSQPGRPYD
ncbi:maleate cis-trans isomerase family protein [Flavisphingomonas formosensis]|uniref:maleate cis-trans isomerase family protein n=1 Tax=Flavisphingomonas formosensis TaxID=861534 RepID=UPI0012F84644|nr:aspartate/glutamate racemase family protein [Sphingomonas formosensis]